MIIILLILLFAISCDYNEPQMIKKHYDQVEGFDYLIDRRTNLCFISNGFGGHGSLLANVPCTPEVMNLMVNK